MSQLSQQIDGSSEPLLLSHDGPTGARHHVQLAPSSSSLLSDSGRRSQRKAAPSPLQTSSTPTSPPASATPTKTTFLRSGVVNQSSSTSTSPTSPSHPHSPRSPTARLDDLLASEKNYYKPEESSIDSIPENAVPSNRYTRPLHDPNATSRSVSDPILNVNHSGASPTSGRSAIAASAPLYRTDMARTLPRTSSIDSAISSISADTHSHQSSKSLQDLQGGPDITNLINAAGGSAESVIQYLLKEKSSQKAQNEQLWRLVDKQRAMILGLNKDLERAMKDKDRYKKKLKGTIAQLSNPSPVESTVGATSSDAGSVASDQKTVEPAGDSVEALASAGVRGDSNDLPPSPIDVALAPYPITPPPVANDAEQHSPVLANMVAAEQHMPSPTKHAYQQYNPDISTLGTEEEQAQKKLNEVVPEVPYNASLPPSRSLPSDPPKHPPPNIPPPKAPMSSQAPTLSVIEATPNPDEGLRTFPAPPRKAPPAPLDLSQRNDPSNHLRRASGTADETDSDYDDILDVDEIPSFTERGRRKTRDEDDKQREYAAMKDAEARSLSKKSKGSAKGTPKSRPTTPKEGSLIAAMDPMPMSARQTFPISPPDAQSRHLVVQEAHAGSLNGILNEGLKSPQLKSPGLPLSPRPIDRSLASPGLRNPSSQSPLNSPPLSPRGLGAFPAAVPLSPRAPRQPIPLPPNTPMSIASPGFPKGDPLHLVSPKPLTIAKKPGEGRESSPKDEPASTQQSPSDQNKIYRGLVTDEYPDLLLPPNALPSIDVRVASSRLKPSRASILLSKNLEEDQPVFTLAVFARSNGRELWRVEKDPASLAQLDQALKKSPYFMAKTPDRSLFSGHAPAKVDARRVALNRYLDEILNTQMEMGSALEVCRYLTADAMEPNGDEMTPGGDSPRFGESPVRTGPGGRPLKSGYLTKRGKNFGGWKARFFVLDGPIFKYYESPGGPHLGAIKLQNAQIGKQQQHADRSSPSRGDVDDADNQYRHAFLILEPKRKDSSSLVRHVLCAESDQERDQWVSALVKWVDFKVDDDEDVVSKHDHNHSNSGSSNHANGAATKKKHHSKSRNQAPPEHTEDNSRGVNHEDPRVGSARRVSRSKHAGTPSPPTHGHDRDPFANITQPQPAKNTSAPKKTQSSQEAAGSSSKPSLLAPDDKIKQKKRSFFGFGSKPRISSDHENSGGADSTSNLSQMAYEQHGPIRPTFGAPLGEAVRFNHPVDVNVNLPAVVYRCIEYLDAKNAAGEEGIFRLSGSNVVIRQLRERFNSEGDVNLVTDDQYYDIHAVASLLKLYLRELPTTILTRELHLEFVAVTELQDVNDKIDALNGLVHRLPRANNTLLRALSGFLINIINHADTNKMTVRNVGIVFSPTLNIPAPVFALFLHQYDGIFGEEPESHNPSAEINVTAPALSPEDIRSPRRQKFQDLPTPSYNQQNYEDHPVQSPYQQRGGYETGFAPMKPAYEVQYQKATPTMGGPEYGRPAQTLAGPAYDQFAQAPVAYKQHNNETARPSSKSKRRESSMFGMGMGASSRKSSNAKLRDDSRLIHGESFFE